MTIDESLLTRRDEVAPDPGLRNAVYIESVKEIERRAAAARRHQWRTFHESMAELHSRLSAEHLQEAEKLEDKPRST